MKFLRRLLNYKNLFSLNPYIYIPIDELQVEFDTDKVNLKTDWFSIVLQVSHLQLLAFHEVGKYLKDKNKKILLSKDVQIVLSKLQDYPIVFREKVRQIKGLESISFSQIQTHIDNCMSQYDSSDKVQVKSLKAECVFEKHMFFKKGFPLYISSNGESAYMLGRYIRYKYFSSFVFTEDMYSKLRKLKTEDMTRFKQAIALVLKQNCMVTHLCDLSIRNASNFHGKIGELAEDFRKSELHHDHLLIKSLESLGYKDVDQIETLPETIAMMAVLKHASSTNAFSYALCVESFEGGVASTGSKLISDMLEGESLKEVRKGIHAHHVINEKGNHGSIGREFGQHIPHVSKQEYRDGVINLISVIVCQQQLSLQLLARFHAL